MVGLTLRRALLAGLALSIGGMLGIQCASNGHYQCEVCGSQRYLRKYLLVDLSEHEYDEFGTQARWQRAHRRECTHVWTNVRGLDGIAPGWSRLQWAVAIQAPHAAIQEILANDPRQGAYVDRFHRSALHWAYATDVREDYRSKVVEKLRASAVPDSIDVDGMRAEDWAF